MKLLLNTLMALCFITTAAIACPPSGDADGKAEASSEVEMKLAKLDLNVVGMTCGGCENKVKAALGSIDGIVETHKVSSESNEASLTYDPAVTTEEQIIEALGKKTGYSVTMITSAAKTGEAKACSKECAKDCCANKTEAEKAACANKSEAEKAACAKSKKASCSKAKASADKELKEEK